MLSPSADLCERTLKVQKHEAYDVIEEANAKHGVPTLHIVPEDRDAIECLNISYIVEKLAISVLVSRCREIIAIRSSRVRKSTADVRLAIVNIDSGRVDRYREQCFVIADEFEVRLAEFRVEEQIVGGTDGLRCLGSEILELR